jgi:hypothetical protein
MRDANNGLPTAMEKQAWNDIGLLIAVICAISAKIISTARGNLSLYDNAITI